MLCKNIQKMSAGGKENKIPQYNLTIYTKYSSMHILLKFFAFFLNFPFIVHFPSKYIFNSGNKILCTTIWTQQVPEIQKWVRQNSSHIQVIECLLQRMLGHKYVYIYSKIYLKGRVGRRDRTREAILTIHLINAHNGQNWFGNPPWFPLWLQSSEHLGYIPLFSRHINREMDKK